MTPEEIAADIAKKGLAGDDVLVALSKGLTDATKTIADLAGRIINMHKGKKPPADDGDGDGAGANAGGSGDEGDDDGDGDDDEGDDAPGYQDMQLGTVGATLDTSNGQLTQLDVTKFVLETVPAQMATLAKGLQAVHDENKVLRKLLRKSLKGQTAIAEMVQTAASAQVGALGPLAKAVADGREALLNIPAAGITPRTFVPRPNAAPVVLLGGTARAERQTLAKAVRTNLITTEMKASFEATRRFVQDEARNTALRAKAEQIASEFAPAV